jgi:hypothetical protein
MGRHDDYADRVEDRGMGRPMPPEEMADKARSMIAAGEEPQPLPSIEAALQLKRALEQKDRAKSRLLNIDSVSDLQERARDYVEAADRSRAAAGVVRSEAGLGEPGVHHVGDSIISRG